MNGDMICTARVKTPETVTPEQLELFNRLKSIDPIRNTADNNGIETYLKRIKNVQEKHSDGSLHPIDQR
jgi:DnaJ-class molecular chaperone